MDHVFLFNRVKQAGVFPAEAVVVAMAKMLDKHKPNNKRVFGSGDEDGGSLPPPAKKRRVG
jgi:hypothetical protein